MVKFFANERKNIFNYAALQLLPQVTVRRCWEMKNRTVVIISVSGAFSNPADQSIFENTFKK